MYVEQLEKLTQLFLPPKICNTHPTMKSEQAVRVDSVMVTFSRVKSSNNYVWFLFAREYKSEEGARSIGCNNSSCDLLYRYLKKGSG